MSPPFLKFITGNKLQKKFILFFIVLAVVPVLALGGITVSLLNLSHRIDVSHLELQFIDQKIKEIEKFFTDTLGILELRVGFTQKSEIETSQQLFLLEGILKENKAFHEVSFINLLGIETTKKTQDDTISELFDVSLVPEFQKAVQGNAFVGPVNYTLSGPLVTMASPVRNQSGDIIQVLSAKVHPDELIQSIQTARIGSTGYLVFLDGHGKVISHGLQKTLPSGLDISYSERIKKLLRGEILNGLAPEDRYKSILSETSVVGAGKKLSSVDWVILAEWPIDDADEVITNVRNQVMRLTLFSILLVALAAPLFAARLVNPIRILQKAASEIEKGNFENQVRIQTQDELQDLGQSFNQMAVGLRRLQELREEFVFIATHELRSPATVIKGYLSMLLENDGGKIPSKAKHYIEQTQMANQRLLSLVENLLLVAKSEAGRIRIEVRPVDIRKPILTSINELQPLADEKSISLHYAPPPTLPDIFGDEERIKEIVVNLVGNAIKYTPQGGMVSVFHEIKKAELTTHVKDNGFGMSKEAQEKLFEKFYRVQNEKTSGIRGTGLGLFIVKQLVEKMNGKIWFESEENKGSTFSFSLPFAKK